LGANHLPDVLAANLSVLFCGLNPAMDAAATGHHFVGRSNRFWRVLHQAGFTPVEIEPTKDRSLLAFGCGITAVASRPTISADHVTKDEYREGGAILFQKIEKYRPRHVAFLGKAAFTAITGMRHVSWGRQQERVGDAVLWVLPNPSGRNRAFSLAALVKAYAPLHDVLSA
jgi:TDG/mug DNA glycosylase family protein